MPRLVLLTISSGLLIAATVSCGGGGSNECDPACDANACQTCEEGICVSTCGTGRICDGAGNCVSETTCIPPCDPDQCQVCQGGTCVSRCMGAQVCDGQGTCVDETECSPPCDPDQCQTCLDDSCVSTCTGNQVCDGQGNCQDDTCTPPCDPDQCEVCQGTTCVSRCTGNQVCDGNGACQDDTCAPTCDTDQCEVCQGTTCVSTCTGDQVCDGQGTCVDDTECSPPCDSDQCEVCQGTTCVSTCTGDQVCDGQGNCLDEPVVPLQGMWEGTTNLGDTVRFEVTVQNTIRIESVTLGAPSSACTPTQGSSCSNSAEYTGNASDPGSIVNATFDMNLYGDSFDGTFTTVRDASGTFHHSSGGTCICSYSGTWSAQADPCIEIPNDCQNRECGPSPSGCHDCGSCDDSDPCTVDTCVAGNCTYPPLENDCQYENCGPSVTGCFDCGVCPDDYLCGSFGQCHIECDFELVRLDNSHVGGSVTAYYSNGGYLYLGRGRSLHILDEADLSAGPVAKIPLDDIVTGIFAQDGYAYALLGGYSFFTALDLAAIDVSDPLAPGAPVVHQLDGYAHRFRAVGGYGYMATDLGLAIVSLADPLNPGPPSYLDADGSVRDYRIAGNHLYIADSSKGLVIYDITDPQNPGAPVCTGFGGGLDHLDVSGSHAFTTSSFMMRVVNVEDPASPYETANLNLGTSIQRVQVEGTLAYVGHSGDLAVIDVSDPANLPDPVVLADIGFMVNFVVDQGVLRFTQGFGLHRADISDLLNPGEVTLEVDGLFVEDVKVVDGYAYLAANRSVLAVVDISDPAAPGEPVVRDTGTNASILHVDGDYAYLGFWQGPLNIIDISDPLQPGEPIVIDETATRIFAKDGYVYLTQGTEGLAILDARDPLNPVGPVRRQINGGAQGIYVIRDHAFIAAAMEGLAVLEVGNPMSPGGLVYRDTNCSMNIVVDGAHAYLPDGDPGLAIIDVRDPSAPGLPVHAQDTGGYAEAAEVHGGYAFVVNMAHEFPLPFAVVDVRNPANPGQIVQYSTKGRPMKIAADGQYVFVADQENGMEIFEISCTTKP